MEIFVVAFVLSGLLFGFGAGAIANAKNRSFLGYFLLGFFFTLVGLLIAMGMPSLPTAPVEQRAPTAETSVANARAPSPAEAAAERRRERLLVVLPGVFLLTFVLVFGAFVLSKMKW